MQEGRLLVCVTPSYHFKFRKLGLALRRGVTPEKGKHPGGCPLYFPAAAAAAAGWSPHHFPAWEGSLRNFLDGSGSRVGRRLHTGGWVV